MAGSISDDAIHVLTGWIRSQHRRLSAALAGTHLVTTSVPEFSTMAADLQPVIDEMTKADTVIDGAIIYIKAQPGLTQAAVDAALANGATAAQLQPVLDLVAVQKAKVQEMADALTANTPTPPVVVGAKKK